VLEQTFHGLDSFSPVRLRCLVLLSGFGLIFGI
jgi:hypothetical protein